MEMNLDQEKEWYNVQAKDEIPKGDAQKDKTIYKTTEFKEIIVVPALRKDWKEHN